MTCSRPPARRTIRRCPCTAPLVSPPPTRSANTESFLGLFRILSLEMWMRAFTLSKVFWLSSECGFECVFAL